jgi:dTDP-4-amino-4,6-dideoxygalactose transaminase
METARRARRRAQADGGKLPFLKYHSPWIDEEDCRAVVEALQSGWITTGPKTAEFEKGFAAYVGARHAVGVTSCTAALHLALVARGVGPGDEVITTPITFSATGNVIVHAGARPVFADVEPDTLNVDPDEIGRRITRRTRAIVPVHFAGHPCDMDPILKMARRRRIAVIQDSAHSIESQYKGRRMGGMGTAACYSFYATKNITCGEGGMIATDDERLAERLRVLRLHGISRDAWKRYGESGYKHYDTVAFGYKYNMFDVQAALGLSQLRKVEEWWRRRRDLAARYDRAFEGLGRLAVRPDVRTAHYIYVLLVEGRNRALQAIQSRGVGVGVHFRPLHLHAAYRRRFGYRRGSLPRAEWAGGRALSIPLYPKMTDAEQDRVIDAVRAAVGD